MVETSLLINVYFFLIKLATNVVFSFLKIQNDLETDNDNKTAFVVLKFQ